MSKLLSLYLKTIQSTNLSVSILTDKPKGNFQITSSKESSKEIAYQQHWATLANKELHTKNQNEVTMFNANLWQLKLMVANSGFYQ